LPRVSAAACGATRALMAHGAEVGWSERWRAAAAGGLGYSGGFWPTLSSHWTDDGDHLGVSTILSFTSGWPTRHSVWSAMSPPPTEVSEHPWTSEAAATWTVRHDPRSISQAATNPLIHLKTEIESL